MIAFFCSTPYQIMNAIILATCKFRDTPCDIYILNHFSDSEALYGRLAESQVFSQVYLMHVKHIAGTAIRSSWKRYWHFARYLVDWKRTAERYLDTTKIYDEVFYTCGDFIIDIAFNYYKKKNGSLIVNQYEDGTGSYIAPKSDYTKRRRLFMNLIGRPFGLIPVFDQVQSYYAYAPQLIPPMPTRIEKKTIPKMSSVSAELKESLNCIFDYVAVNGIRERFVFLEQPLGGLTNQEDAIIASLFHRIMSAIGSDDVIVKLHPRSSSELYQDIKLYHANSTPWEIICLNNDIGNKVLMSVFSTALLTPKIIFDQEPVIIFLYRLITDSANQMILRDIDKSEEFIDKLRGIYRRPDRIIVPKSVEELHKILVKLKAGQYD